MLKQKVRIALKVGAAVFGSLFLIGSAIGGIYLLNPQIFGADAAVNQVVETNSANANSQVSVANSDIANSNTVFVEAANNAAQTDKDKAQNGEKASAETNPKTAATDKKSKTSTDGLKLPTGDEQITIDGEIW